MSKVTDRYNKLFLQQTIRNLIATGNEVSVDDVPDSVAEALQGNDLSSAQFSSANYRVTSHSESSAGLQNNTNKGILDDLSVLYTVLFGLSNEAMQSIDRWKSELNRLEGELESLEDRISNLLLAEKDTEGFFSVVSDNFVDTERVNLDDSSGVIIDLAREQVSLGTSSEGTTRIFLNNITSEDINFTVLSRRNIQSVTEADGSNILNSVNDNTKFWQHQIRTSKPIEVVSELVVQLSATPISISRITVQLHAANTNAAIQVTPMYSTDGFTYSQLPTTSFSQSLLKRGTFTFPEIEATHIKLLMVKSGHDYTDNLLYVYEFGADEIAFYSEKYSDTDTGQFYSTALWVADAEGNPLEFNRCALSTCDLIPDNTTLDYYVAASNNLETTASGLNFVQISPLEKDNPIYPQVINFTDLEEFEFGNTTVSGEFVKVSYDLTQTSGIFINPAAGLTIVDISGSSLSETSHTASGIRYALPSHYDRILDHQLDADIDLKDNQLTLFRNVGIQGNTEEVRGVQSGWSYTDPYYSTIVEVKNSTGVSINFGEKTILIDDVAVSGEVNISQGLHLVRVHRNNWIHVNPDDLETNNLTSLRAIDPLYPYNHKMLVEGMSYPTAWDDEEIYVGFDLFAESVMDKVSPFDMLNSVENSDYKKYAIDLDVGEGSRPSSRVILVKVDSTNPDFINERFAVRFNVNTESLKFKYVYLRVDLGTNDVELAPILDSYKIKLGT